MRDDKQLNRVINEALIRIDQVEKVEAHTNMHLNSHTNQVLTPRTEEQSSPEEYLN